MPTRRDVLRGGLAAALLACAHPRTAPKRQRILILGGTGFIGPKMIEAAVSRGHHVTIFNRGKQEKSTPLAFDVERLYGNRDPLLRADDHDPNSPQGLEQLVGKQWDVVIDNSGFFPRMVEASAKLLANSGRYIFISSIYAYAAYAAAGNDESAPLATLADPATEDFGAHGENYGGLKALCEHAVTTTFGDRAVIARCGFIVGPGDNTDRLSYWPHRMQDGGEVLAPGTPDDPIQWIDVRDLAAWLMLVIERGTTGTFNVVASPMKWGDVLAACRAGTAATLTWVPSRFLEEHGMTGEDGEGAATAFPIWHPSTGLHRINNARARAAGLTARSSSDTIRGIVDWLPGELAHRTKPGLHAGPTRDRERELLAAWHSVPEAK